MRRRSVDSKPVTINLPNGDNYAATVVWDQDPPQVLPRTFTPVRMGQRIAYFPTFHRV